MEIDDCHKIITIMNESCALLGHLPTAIETVRHIITHSGLKIKADDGTLKSVNDCLNHKKSREEKKCCKAILKKHGLPKSVGIMCRSENDICFIPNKAIVDIDLNNLRLQSPDGAAQLNIGGGYFEFTLDCNEAGFVHQRRMCGTVIRHNGEIFLLRHPLGGFPNYLAKLDLFINGMIITLDDGLQFGLYY